MIIIYMEKQQGKKHFRMYDVFNKLDLWWQIFHLGGIEERESFRGIIDEISSIKE